MSAVVHAPTTAIQELLQKRGVFMRVDDRPGMLDYLLKQFYLTIEEIEFLEANTPPPAR